MLLAPCLALGVTLAVGEATAPRRMDTLDAVAPAARLRALEQRLDALRSRWRVPGMSAAIASGGDVIWTRGFGLADRATGRAATPETVFHLGSLTKPFAAAVLLQLAEEGRLTLDAPVTEFGIDLPSSIRVVHLLTHTSEGATPGVEYHYNGDRFSQLDKVVEKLTGTSFAQAVHDRVLRPLTLADTAPNPLLPERCVEAHRDAAAFAQRMAQGYTPDGKDPVPYRPLFATAAGLVATASDMARFSIAWDSDVLLPPAARARAFTPFQSPAGRTLPYGLGWFVDGDGSNKIVWHYGWWVGASALVVKVPDRALTFVLLANSDGLSRKFDLGKDQNVRRSPFAKAFLSAFVDGEPSRML
jgi:CubicO group peptidase (beta-lactamase class C family)